MKNQFVESGKAAIVTVRSADHPIGRYRDLLFADLIVVLPALLMTLIATANILYETLLDRDYGMGMFAILCLVGGVGFGILLVCALYRFKTRYDVDYQN